MDASLSIPNAEYQARAGKLLHHIKSKDLKGVVLFNHHYVLYLSGFGFIPTERPMAFVDSTTKCNFEGRKERRAAVG